MTKLSSCLNKTRLILQRYLNGNWGFLFIVAFLLLLFNAAVFLATSSYYASMAESAGNSATSAELTTISTSFASMAEAIATYSYFVLAIGVLFQVGNVNSKTVQDVLVRIRKFRIALKLVRLGKNRLKNGVVFDGSS